MGRKFKTTLVVLFLVCLYAGICGALTFFLETRGLLSCAVLVLLGAMLLSEEVEQKAPSAQWLLPLGVIVSVMAALTGICNYHAHYAPYLNTKAGRTYYNVTATAVASAYLDGGIIHFDNDSVVDTTRSLGFMSHGFTYCVAPIFIQQQGDDEHPVQFWAVGRDCCNARSSFECGDAGDNNTHGGLVMHDTDDWISSEIFAPRSHLDEWRHAASAAGAIHGMTVAEPAAFVRWENSPERVVQHLKEAAIWWFIGTSILNAIFVLCVWCPIQSHYDAEIEKVKRKIEKVKRTFPKYGATQP
jgi:hypothetical protein